MNAFFYLLIALLIIIAGVPLSIFVFKKRRGKRLARLLSFRLLLVKIPQQKKKDEGGKKDPVEEINVSSQFFKSLADADIPFVLEIAVHNVGEDIHFYLAVPEKAIQTAMRAVQGFWPGADIQQTDDYTIFSPEGIISGAVIRLKDSAMIPIRAYTEAKLDTFQPLLSTFSNLATTGEGIALQVLVRSAPQAMKTKVKNAIYKLKKGEKLKYALQTSLVREFLHTQKTVKRTKDGQIIPEEPKIVDEESVKVLEQKISKPTFAVNIRLFASAATKEQADALLDALADPFSQFEAPRYNAFKVQRFKNAEKLVSKFIFREFDEHEKLYLNGDEVASVIHFPISETDVPRVKWLKFQESAPPTNLPKGGTIIGESNFRGERRPVYVSEDDRRRHIYVIGQTGTGKSTLMQGMVIDDIKTGKGVSIIDPHGDLVETILEHIPKERAEDVILFNPGDIERPLGLNMIEFDFNHPEQKTFIVNEMQAIFNKLFDKETMGPMFEQYMRNALLLLMEDSLTEPATLIEVPRIFTDTDYRRRKLMRIANPTVVDFWEKEAIKAGGEASLANMTPYITSKFNNFIANDFIRPIIGQPKSAFNFRSVMDERKILLVNLSKGRIGDINAGLIGMVIVGKLLMAALSRVDVPQEERKDFYLYIDEFQNF